MRTEQKKTHENTQTNNIEHKKKWHGKLLSQNPILPGIFKHALTVAGTTDL